MNQLESYISTCPVCEKEIPRSDRLVLDGGAIHCPDCWLTKEWPGKGSVFKELRDLLEF